MASKKPFDKLAEMQDESVFADSSAIEGRQSDTKPIARESEIANLESQLDRVLFGSAPRNLFVTGGNGTGKTTVVSHVLNERSSQDGAERDVEWVRTDCHTGPDAYHLSLKLVNQLRDRENRVRRGTQRDAVYQTLADELNPVGTEGGDRTAVVFVLENIDRVEGLGTVLNRLAELNRQELDSGTTVSVLGISPNPEAVPNHADGAYDFASIPRVEFDGYTATEVSQILAPRVEAAFRDTTAYETDDGVVVESDVLTQAAFDRVTEATTNTFDGDVRYAFKVLRGAGKKADRDSSKCITITEVEADIDELQS